MVLLIGAKPGRFSTRQDQAITMIHDRINRMGLHVELSGPYVHRHSYYKHSDVAREPTSEAVNHVCDGTVHGCR